MELNNKEVVMAMTASQGNGSFMNVPFMHVCGKLKVTKCTVIEFVVGDAIVRADMAGLELIDRKGGADIREISFYINNAERGMSKVHCLIRRIGK